MKTLPDTRTNRARLANDPMVHINEAATMLRTRAHTLRNWCETNKIGWVYEGAGRLLKEEEDRFEECDLTPEQKETDEFQAAKAQADAICDYWKERGFKVQISYVPTWSVGRHCWDRFDVRSDLLGGLPRRQ